MGRSSSVIPLIKAALEVFICNGGRLPATNEGKVNVAALCRMLKGIPEDYTQHFHKKEEIKDIVNAMAAEQGLLPIGTRSTRNEVNSEIEQRIVQTSKQAKEDAQAAVEATSAQHSLLVELKAVRTELARKDLEIAALKERFRLVEEGSYFVRI